MDALYQFGHWLRDTPLSEGMRAFLPSNIWLAPLLQSIHILSVAVIFGSAGVINLRLLGLVARSEAPAALIRRLAPFVWAALVVMLLTGSVFILNRPPRYFGNWSFLTKVPLILVACGFMAAMQWAARRNPAFAATPGIATRALGGVALLVWVGIVFAGRWIAYA